MAYINQVTLMGHLTADPELKTTPAGDSVATFSVAVNSKSKTGENRAEFFDVEIWKGWATNLCKTARKGALVLLTGRLKQERWLSKTDENRQRVKIVAQRAFHIQTQYAGEEAEREVGEEDVPY